jgi:hypothetical protein
LTNSGGGEIVCTLCLQRDSSNSCIIGCFIFVTITVTEKNSRDANECESPWYLKKTSVPEHQPGALEWRTGALEWWDKAKVTPNHCDGSMVQRVVALSRRVGVLPRLPEDSL